MPSELRGIAIACLNPDCKKLTLTVAIDQFLGGESWGRTLLRWGLMPESRAIQQPGYIPDPLVEDYYEACRIRDLSPKASATLARRCLQGMIRDFCKIARGTLDAEIKELRSEVEQRKAPAGCDARKR